MGIAEKFTKDDMIGPVWVRQFVEGTPHRRTHTGAVAD